MDNIEVLRLLTAVLQLIEDEETWMYQNILNLCMFADTPQNYFTVLAFREEHSRIPLFSEEWLELYINSDFFQLFRMRQESFEVLLREVSCEITDKEFVGGHVPISGEKMLLMTLWWLGKSEVLKSISDRFNISLSAAHKCITAVLDLLITLLPRYIIWPDNEDLVRIEVAFREKDCFPGVVGAIVGCNIKFKAPAAQQASYIDRKQQHSLKLQAVVSPEKNFTNIYAGFPGSAHDSRVLQNSGLFADVEENGEYRKYCPLDEYHIVCDSAYPLLTWLMKPYPRNYNFNATKDVLIKNSVKQELLLPLG